MEARVNFCFECRKFFPHTSNIDIYVYVFVLVLSNQNDSQLLCWHTHDSRPTTSAISFMAGTQRPAIKQTFIDRNIIINIAASNIVYACVHMKYHHQIDYHSEMNLILIFMLIMFICAFAPADDCMNSGRQIWNNLVVWRVAKVANMCESSIINKFIGFHRNLKALQAKCLCPYPCINNNIIFIFIVINLINIVWIRGMVTFIKHLDDWYDCCLLFRITRHPSKLSHGAMLLPSIVSPFVFPHFEMNKVK